MPVAAVVGGSLLMVNGFFLRERVYRIGIFASLRRPRRRIWWRIKRPFRPARIGRVREPRSLFVNSPGFHRLGRRIRHGHFAWRIPVRRGILQHQQVPKGALVHAVDEREARFGGEYSKGGGKTGDSAAFGGLVVEGLSDHGGFDGPGAAHAPVGGGQVLDHGEFDAIGGLEAVQMLAEHGLEQFAGFFRQDHALGQKTVAHGVAGSEFSLGRSGPRERAPLAREDWTRGEEVMGTRHHNTSREAGRLGNG
jgi:hypothetical protein